MTDISKIRVGDEVTVLGIVLEVGAYALKVEVPLAVLRDPLCGWVDLSKIATHTPAPFKIGDRVQIPDDHTVGRVFGISKSGLIAVEWDDKTSNTYDASFLIHIR